MFRLMTSLMSLSRTLRLASAQVEALQAPHAQNNTLQIHREFQYLGL